MKNFRHGQAALLTGSDFAKIRRQIKKPEYRLIWDITRWTGERWGAILQLNIVDVYSDAARSRPHEDITFRARTRKASPSGKRRTRQVPVHDTLREILEAYKPQFERGLLFPSPRFPDKPLTLRSADWVLRQAVAQAGLEHKGISTHSTRVSFITDLHKKGISAPKIQQLTGHQDLKVVSRYIVVTPDEARAAIAVL